MSRYCRQALLGLGMVQLGTLVSTGWARGQTVVHGYVPTQVRNQITLKNGTVLSVQAPEGIDIVSGANIVGEQWISIPVGSTVTFQVLQVPGATQGIEHSISFVPDGAAATPKMPFHSAAPDYDATLRLASAVGDSFSVTGGTQIRSLISALFDSSRYYPNQEDQSKWPYWKVGQNSVSVLRVLNQPLSPGNFAPTVSGTQAIKQAVMSISIVDATIRAMSILKFPQSPIPQLTSSPDTAVRVVATNEFFHMPYGPIWGMRKWTPSLGEGLTQTAYGTERLKNFTWAINHILNSPQLNDYERHVWMAYFLPKVFNSFAAFETAGINTAESGGHTGDVNLSWFLAPLASNHPYLLTRAQAAKTSGRVYVEEWLYTGSDGQYYWGAPGGYQPDAYEGCRTSSAYNNGGISWLKWCGSASQNPAIRVGDLGNASNYLATFNAQAIVVEWFYQNYAAVRNITGPLKINSYLNRYWREGSKHVPAGYRNTLINTLTNYQPVSQMYAYPSGLSTLAARESFATSVVNALENYNGSQCVPVNSQLDPDLFAALDQSMVSQNIPSMLGRTLFCPN